MRRNFLALAKESEELVAQGAVDEQLAAPVTEEDELAAVDPVAVEVEQEIIPEGDQMEEAAAEMEAAVADTEELGDLSEGLTANVEANGTGPDEFGAALAAERIATLIKKHDLGQNVVITKESLATPANRRVLNLHLAKEADDAKATLWERVKKAIAGFVQWIKNFFQNVVTKAGRMKAAAVAKAKQLNTAGAGTAKVNAYFDKPAEYEKEQSASVSKLLKAYSDINNGKNIGDQELTEAHNPVYVSVKYEGDNPSVHTQVQEMNQREITVSGKDVVTSLMGLARTLDVFNKAVADAKSVKEDAPAAGKEADQGAADAAVAKAKAVLARLKARSAIMGAANKTMFRYGQQLLDVANQAAVGLGKNKDAAAAAKAADQARGEAHKAANQAAAGAK